MPGLRDASPLRTLRQVFSPGEWHLAAVFFGFILASFLGAAVVFASLFAGMEKDAALAAIASRQIEFIKTSFSVHNPRSYPDFMELLQNHITVSPMTGATLLNNQFQVFKSTGDRPSVAVGRGRNNKTVFLETDDGCCIDLVLPKEKSELPYHIVVRIETGRALAQLASRNRRAAGFLGLILLTGCLVAGAVLFGRYIRPLGALKSATAHQLAPSLESRPASWPAGPMPEALVARRDLIGDIARQISVMKGASLPNDDIGQTASSAAEPELTNDLPFCIVSFDASGDVTHANDAALWFFQAQTLVELKTMDLGVFGPVDQPELKTQSLPEMLADSELDLTVNAHIHDEPVSYRLVAHSSYGDDGETAGLLVCLLPPDRPYPGSSGNEPPAHGDQAKLQLQNMKLKLQLEACLSLLETPDAKALQSAAAPVRPDIMVETWYNEAARCGLIDPGMVHNVPGPIVGDAVAAEAIIRHALSFMVFRSGAQMPVLTGEGSVISPDAVCFKFEEVDGPDLAAADADQPGDWKLPLAALTRMLAAYGGKVQATRGEDDRNLIRFILRSKPVRSSGQGPLAEKTAA